MPSTHTIVLVTLLPIPIIEINIPQKQVDEQQQTNRGVLNGVLGGYCSLSLLNKISMSRVGITTFPVQMPTSGVAYRFSQHGLQ
jgi:hypothetical protein